MNNKKVTLVGGGLAGSVLAIYLAKRNYQVHIYEKRPDMRKNEYQGGKSINLALSERGLRALRILQIDQDILNIGIPMRGRMIHDIQGQLSYQPYGHQDQAIYSVSRGALNIKLLQLASQFPNISISFDHECTHADLHNGTTTYTNAHGQVVTDKADWVIATDGAYSAVRSEFQRSGMFNYSQQYEQHGYKELEILPNFEGDFAMNKNCLHIWPRKSFMMIALPNPDKTFTCTLFLPFAGEPGFDDLNTDQEITDFFAEQFPDAVPLMPNYISDFKSNPIGSLVTVRCFPWVKGNTALLGDSAHAVVPFYGQGMNCSFEDCTDLDFCLQSTENDMDKALQMYQSRRVENANAIADLALQNFIEMRDLVGDKQFLQRKAIEHELSAMYPQQYKSQYEWVTFSTATYKQAQQMGAKNNALIDKILNENLLSKVSDEAFMSQLFEQML